MRKILWHFSKVSKTSKVCLYTLHDNLKQSNCPLGTLLHRLNLYVKTIDALLNTALSNHWTVEQKNTALSDNKTYYACFPSQNCSTEDNLSDRFSTQSTHFPHPCLTRCPGLVSKCCYLYQASCGPGVLLRGESVTGLHFVQLTEALLFKEICTFNK